MEEPSRQSANIICRCRCFLLLAPAPRSASYEILRRGALGGEPSSTCPTFVTVAILAQGASWADAMSGALCFLGLGAAARAARADFAIPS